MENTLQSAMSLAHFMSGRLEARLSPILKIPHHLMLTKQRVIRLLRFRLSTLLIFTSICAIYVALVHPDVQRNRLRRQAVQNLAPATNIGKRSSALMLVNGQQINTSASLEPSAEVTRINLFGPVSYTHLTLPTILLV